MNSQLCLGIHLGHDASAALVDEGGLVALVREEQCSNIKHYNGFPAQAIKYLLDNHLADRSISALAFSSLGVPIQFAHEAVLVNDRGQISRQMRTGNEDWCVAAVDRILNYFSNFPGRPHVAYMRQIRMLASVCAGVVHFIHHHRAHAAAHLLLPGDWTRSIVLDGKGDGLSGSVFDVAGGKFQLERGLGVSASLGAFYQCSTELLGFVGIDGEYKLMGLAAFGSIDAACFDDMYRRLRLALNLSRRNDGLDWEWVHYDKLYPGRATLNPLQGIRPPPWLAAWSQKLLSKDFAATVQAVYVKIFCEFLAASTKAGDRVLLAGGCALNCKANQIARRALPDRSLFVFPDAADSGLSAGAAGEALRVSGATIRPRRFPKYVGRMARNINLPTGAERLSIARACELICSGRIVGIYSGRSELGPRALGNRSIVASPIGPDMVNKINRRKGREPFVPVSPAVDEKYANDFFVLDGDEEFMTFATDAKPLAFREVPAVIHVDGSVRPQIVSRSGDTILSEILQALPDFGHPPVLINTSFNRHGNPTVDDPSEVSACLRDGVVDALFL